MKSERGQIQESNLLADKIEAQLGQLRQSLPAILGIGGLAIIGFVAYGIYTTQRDAAAARAWTALYFSDTDEPPTLLKIAEDFKSTPAAGWAQLTAADASMARAVENVYLSRDLAEQYYQQASDEYGEVAKSASDPFLKSRAIFGLAQATEGLGDRDKAIAEYRKIASIQGLAPEFLAAVSKQVQWLESKDGEEFFAWFKTMRPSAPKLEPNATGLPTLPGMQNFTLPPVEKSPMPGSEATLPTAPATPASSPTVEPATPPAQPTGAATEAATGEPKPPTLDAPGADGSSADGQPK